MEKKRIALAIAAIASGSALAQSNVTISGQFKESFENVRATGASAGGAADLTSRNRVTDQNSWLRFSGQEDLGMGLTAWFQVESAIGTSDNVGTTGAAPVAGAATGTGVGTRNTAVGLKGAWGNLFMGKWDVYYHTAYLIDTGPAGNLPMSLAALDLLHTNGQGNSFGGRLNNTVFYESPNWTGLAFKLGYTTSGTGGSANENTSPGLAAKESGWTFNPTYVNGPISAFYAYYRHNNIGATSAVTPGASGQRLTANRFGGSWAFPMGFKVGFIWDKNKIETEDGSMTLGALGSAAGGGSVAAHNRRERDAWAIPASFAWGPNTIYATYGESRKVETTSGDLPNSRAKFGILAWDYALSKRTAVNLSLARINNDGNARYDFWHPSDAVGAQSSTGLPAGADPQAVLVGVRHQF